MKALVGAFNQEMIVQLRLIIVCSTSVVQVSHLAAEAGAEGHDPGEAPDLVTLTAGGGGQHGAARVTLSGHVTRDT